MSDDWYSTGMRLAEVTESDLAQILARYPALHSECEELTRRDASDFDKSREWAMELRWAKHELERDPLQAAAKRDLDSTPRTIDLASMPTAKRRWFQVSLSFLLVMIGLVACGLAAFKLMLLHPSLDTSPGLYLVLTAITLYPTLMAGAVLLLGRGRVVVPMASGFILAFVWLCFARFNEMNVSWALAPYFGYCFGSALGMTVLLWERITALRLLLAASVACCLGCWIAIAYFP